MRFNLVCLTVALATLAAASVFPTAANAQNLIQNPGFESSLTNWTLTGNANASLYANYGMTPTPAFGTGMFAFNGGDAGPNAALSQSFATVPGQLYRVSFVYGNFATNPVGGAQLVTAAAINTSNAALLGSVTPSDVVGGTQTGFAAVMDTTSNFTFNAIGITTTLRFTDSALSTTASSDGILDNISVVAVPEAGAFPLVGIGIALASIAVVRRKRTA